MSVSEEHDRLVRAQTTVEGFGELFDAYYERIYAYAYRRVGTRDAAEDVAACTFEDALRGIKRVRWNGKPIIAWLYRIASRRVADYYRRAKDHVPAEWETLREVEGATATLEQAERYAAVLAALGRLSIQDREIIQFIFFDELEPGEIAGFYHCTANSVYVRRHRALRKLRAILEEAAEDD